MSLASKFGSCAVTENGITLTRLLKCTLDLVLNIKHYISVTAGGFQTVKLDETPRTSMVTSADRRQPQTDYRMASYTVKLRKKLPNDLLELNSFNGD